MFKRIAFFGGGWLDNIGNSFIHLGAMTSIKQACPAADVFYVTNSVDWYFNYRPFSKQEKFIDLLSNYCGRIFGVTVSSFLFSFWQRQQEKIDSHKFNLIQYLDVDYLVMGGIWLSVKLLDTYQPLLIQLRERGVKLVYLGAGGSVYTEEEKQLVQKSLQAIKPYALVSRDHETYENYKDLFIHAYDGIDSAFFINDAFKPVSLIKKKYIVLAFDSSPCPVKIEPGQEVITLHHSAGKPKWKHFLDKDVLISEAPEDYLNIFANCQETHSDRVHACVATLAFGHAARLYSKTHRAKLFDQLEVSEIRRKLVKLDLSIIQKKKKLQLEFIKEIFS